MNSQESKSRVDEAPADFGRLARRMADWTTKGVFSALVLVAGLGFGRQVIVWWRSGDAPQAASTLTDAPLSLADGREPIEIAIGDLSVRLGRQTIEGDLAEAIKALRAAGRGGVVTALPWSPVVDADEQQLLARLAVLKPADVVSSKALTDGTDACLYEPSPGMPLIVGTRRIGAGLQRSTENATALQTRVVLWGLAAPAGDRLWTLYLFQSDQPPINGKTQQRVPMPPGCRRLMAFSQQDAETLAFQGPGACGDYQRYYAAWLAKQRPGADSRWRRSGEGGWHVMIEGERSDPSAVAQPSLLIHLAPGPRGGCTGFVFVSG
jgi:hypothetical protein